MKTRQDDTFDGDTIERRIMMFFLEIERDARKTEAMRAKADPKGNRATRVFDPGVHAGYRYYPVKQKGRPEVRFCYSVNRNAAGYFLVWREVVTRRQVKRDEWDAAANKRVAIAHCRREKRLLEQARADAQAKRSGGGDA